MSNKNHLKNIGNILLLKMVVPCHVTRNAPDGSKSVKVFCRSFEATFNTLEMRLKIAIHVKCKMNRD